MTHYNLVHKFLPMPSDENSGWDSSSGCGMEKGRDKPSMETEKALSKKEVILEA